MRDFHDAKAMAKTLRKALTDKTVAISHGESLELVSQMLGFADWNTLSAMLQTERRETGPFAMNQPMKPTSYPALPIRDLVPFPTACFPLYVGREETRQALDRAFQRNREVVLAVQKDANIDAPVFGDIYEIGVLARLLELEILPENRVRKAFRRTEASRNTADSTMKVLVQAYRRVTISGFIGIGGAFQAEIFDISEGPIRNAPQLVLHAAEKFKNYLAAIEAGKLVLPAYGEIRDPARTREKIARHMREVLPSLNQIHDPGRMADVIAQQLQLPVGEKQELLAMLDPIARLTRVVTHIALF